MHEKSGIYSIQNLLTGMIYIGRASNLVQRKYNHFYELRKNKHGNQHLQNSFNKYGIEMFEYEVLEYCDKEHLQEREQYYLDLYLYTNNWHMLYNTNHDSSGISSGAKHPASREIVQIDVKTEKVIRVFSTITEACKVYNVHNSHISDCLRGKRYMCAKSFWAYKEVWDNEQWIRPIYPRLIVQIDPGTFEVLETFIGTRDASESTGIRQGGISECIHGRHKSAGGFYWAYKDDYKQWEKPKYAHGDNRFGTKAINKIDINTGEILKTFESIKEATKSVGKNPSNITNCLSGRCKTAYGFRWEYTKEYKKRDIPLTKPRLRQIEAQKRPVIQIDTSSGQEIISFSSIKEASEVTGISRSAISGYLSGKRKSKEGVRWEYINEK